MGNKVSSGSRSTKQIEEAEKEQKELQRNVNMISKYLKEHEAAVYGISHSVETQAATILMLSSKISKIRSVKEIDRCDKQADGSNQIICCHCTTDWQEYTNKSLGSVQTSLGFQSKSLYNTFQRLNGHVNEIKEYYKIEVGTPVDISNDHFCIDYKDSPTMDYKEEYKKLQSEAEELMRSIANLESCNKEKDQTINEMTQGYRQTIAEKNKEMQNEKNNLESYIHDMKEKIREQEEKLCEIEEKSKVQEEKIQDMQCETEGLREEKISLEKDMKEMKKAITVQLFHNLRGGMIPPLLHELKTMLATKMQMKRHEIQFIICQTETDVNPKIPVFVFCINASRLGTDAATAIHNLKVSSKVSILVFHHKDVHALPSQASERVLTEPMFKDLGGIFDIAFLADKGIYTCDMNTASAVGIEQFLRTQC